VNPVPSDLLVSPGPSEVARKKEIWLMICGSKIE
jgi:hypothetical protein